MSHANPHTRAALLMLGSTVFFGLMAVAIRLASETLHTFEIAFFRNFFGVVAALPLLRAPHRQYYYGYDREWPFS